ncbi:hypothetical protein BXZ70DRAFT_937813 [Cristinia sonorae]|uniref:Uncharacterized protein n=1 Tax=Cristinia sonorae TaxID=1940300 RepID=A0A8K0XPZ1_9AGAR|nr:hypothetical protein BXZ70DRAFT_937813 [Cristinia sonorae]
MLKRQRPASPISFLEDDTVAANIYEPDNKRRRYFAPHSHTSKQKQDGVHPNDTDEEDGEGSESGRREYYGNREWHAAAGVYKDANSLLHELHAEQRHRVLFSPHASSFSTSVMNTLATHRTTQLATFQSAKVLPSALNGDLAGHPQRQLAVNFDGAEQMDHDGEGRDESVEAQVVSQRYENTNRILRSLFLSRRRDIGSHDRD